MQKAKGLVVALLRHALIREWAHVHGGTTKIRLFSWIVVDSNAKWGRWLRWLASEKAKMGSRRVAQNSAL